MLQNMKLKGPLYGGELCVLYRDPSGLKHINNDTREILSFRLIKNMKNVLILSTDIEFRSECTGIQ